MDRAFPISPDKTPNAVLEVILRLKVKEAMTGLLRTANKTDSLRRIQEMMKESRISGVPIVDDDRLVGMVSVDDIMTALDKGYIEDSVEKYMTRKLVVLEDDMPLSFAISYFNKYPFRRFPVINKERKLVGILSSRDVLSRLVHELDREIKELEEKYQSDKTDNINRLHKEYLIKKFDFEKAGLASFEIKKILKEKNINPKLIRRAAVASYELEINTCIHSDGGRLIFSLDEDHIVIVARDDGPGIADVNLVLQEGYTTANEWIRSLGFGAGMGLPNTKRVSDEFTIESHLGKGTTVKCLIHISGSEPRPAEGATA